MQKKLFSLILLALLIVTTACNSKWDHSDPNMPAQIREQHQNSLDASLAILEENPSDFDALFGVAYEYQFFGDYRKAINYYNKVLALYPNDPVTLNNMADIYEQVGEYDLAAESVMKLYVLRPDNIEVIKDTVRILLKADDPTHALEALENFTILQEDADAEMIALISDLRQQIEDYQAEHSDQQ